MKRSVLLLNTGICHFMICIFAVLIVLIGACKVKGQQPEHSIDTLPQSELLELSLEELLMIQISSTGFFDSEQKKSPGTAHLLSHHTIEFSHAIHLADILESNVPSVYIGNTRTNGAIYGTRGILIDNNAKTLVMYNGQILNQRAQYGYWAGFKQPLLGDIERIEVINGPGGVVHGSGALNGTINIVPKSGATSPGFHRTVTYGFRDQLIKGEASWGKEYGKSSNAFVYLGLAYGQGHEVQNDFGYFTDAFIYSNGAPARYRASPDQWGPTVNAYPEPNVKGLVNIKHHGLSVQSLVQITNHSTNSFSFTYGPESFVHQKTYSLRPRLTFDLGEKEQLDFSISSEAFDYEHVYTIEPRGSELHSEFKSIFRSSRIPKNQIAIGCAGGIRFFQDKMIFPTRVRTDLSNSVKGKWYEGECFIEDIFNPLDNLTIAAGIRYDIASQEGLSFTVQEPYMETPKTFHITPNDEHVLTKRIAAALDITDKNTLKASYQEGFRYPDALYYRWWVINQNQLALNGYDSLNEIKPEFLRSFEIGHHYNSKRKKLSIDGTIFYNIFHNMIHYHNYNISDEGKLIPSGTLSDGIVSWLGGYDNAFKDYQAAGGEVSLIFKPVKTTSVQCSYAYSQPIKIKNSADNSIRLTNNEGTQWANFPSHIIKCDLTKNLFEDKLLLRLNGIYNSPLDTDEPVQFPEFGEKDLYANPRFILNGYAEFKLYDNYSIALSAKNILGNKTPAHEYTIINYKEFSTPWSGNLGSDERLVYLSFKSWF